MLVESAWVMLNSDKPTDGNCDQDWQVGRALNELLDRQRSGESINETRLRAEYPEFADQLLAHLNILIDLKDPRDPIDQLIARGALKAAEDSSCRAVLGPYRITEVLGQGGMAIVLKAREDRLGRTVALKLLRADLAHDASALKRFAREARVAGGLQHANVVTTYAVGEHLGSHYIVMEYVRGGTLADVIRTRGPLTVEMARHVFSQVLSGLHAAHDVGLIHRDLKPSNILLGYEDARVPTAVGNEDRRAVKLADFGLALMVATATRMTMADSVLGTPEYMSPEQARGDREIDSRTDLYSAGVVLYEMLTGTTPFRAEKPSAVVHRILHEEPADPHTVVKSADTSLSSLAIRLMAKRPEDRFATAAEAAAALDAGGRVKSVERRRRKVRHTLLGVFAVAFMIIGGLKLMMDLENDRVREVGVDRTRSPSAIAVRRGSSLEWKVLYDFGPGETTVQSARPVDRDGNGVLDLVVACIAAPVGGASVFGFSLTGERLWSWDPTPEKSIRWPDFEEPTTRWCCNDLLVEEVDSEPGDDIVVVAREANEYASRISLIRGSGSTAEVLSTFWHMGHINGIRTISLLDEDRVGLVAWGVNNKLDGFRDPAVTISSEASVASHDIVPIVVVLDPAEMEGISPPVTNASYFSPAKPYAYAYLDLLGKNPRPETPPWDTGAITRFRDCPFLPEETPQGCLSFTVTSCAQDHRDRAVLKVDHHLRLLHVTVGPDETHLTSMDAWESRWRVIQSRNESFDR